MSNTPPMDWATRLANYIAQNGDETLRLKPGQLRRWNKKQAAERRRMRAGDGA